MPADERLLARVRGEFGEMPGLRLSLAQACRLWQLDATTCLALLEQLVAEGYLYHSRDETYMAFPSARPRSAKAALPVAHPPGARARRR